MESSQNMEEPSNIQPKWHELIQNLITFTEQKLCKSGLGGLHDFIISINPDGSKIDHRHWEIINIEEFINFLLVCTFPFDEFGSQFNTYCAFTEIKETEGQKIYYRAIFISSIPRGREEGFVTGIYTEEHMDSKVSYCYLFERTCWNQEIQKTSESYRLTPSKVALVGYMRFIELLGFSTLHIWSNPPEKDDDFIFNGSSKGKQPISSEELQRFYTKLFDHVGWAHSQFAFEYSLTAPPLFGSENDPDVKKKPEFQKEYQNLVETIKSALLKLNLQMSKTIKVTLNRRLYLQVYREISEKSLLPIKKTVHFEEKKEKIPLIEHWKPEIITKDSYFSDDHNVKSTGAILKRYLEKLRDQLKQ
jgi:hypothetical protein